MVPLLRMGLPDPAAWTKHVLDHHRGQRHQPAMRSASWNEGAVTEMFDHDKMRYEITTRVRQEPERLGLEVADMARAMGCTPQRWFNYEAGRRPLDLVTMLKFCDKVDVTTDYLLGRDKRKLQ